MASKSVEVESADSNKSDRKKLMSKGRFTLLISLLLAIIILLFAIIILLMCFNVQNNHKNMNNNETVHNNNKSNNMNKFQDTPEELQHSESLNQPQMPGSQYKLIYRDKWGGRPPLYERPQKVPVKYVIISHTAGAECLSNTTCSKQLQQIQRMHVDAGSPDVGYNFLIGGDANIYVARGWDNHNFHMNLDTIGICFMGNYVYNRLTPEMIEATQHLLKMGVDEGKLDQDYVLVPHNQTYSTISPGPNVYKQIKFWPHFSPDFLPDIDK